MALVYFDSSAFVKLIVEEEGSDLAATLWDACDAAVSSRLAYPEVRSALAAAHRNRWLRAADLATAEQTWEDFWATTRAVELTPSVTLDAGRLASEHALRLADAVHLASAQAIGSPELIFAVWDERLRAGARAIGLNAAPANR